MIRPSIVKLAACLLGFVPAMNAAAAVGWQGQDGAVLPDQRTLDSYFPMRVGVPLNSKEWQTERQSRREHLAVSLGLHPLPTRHPLNAVVHDLQDCGDYTIEDVYFESWPGFFVSGNLYRPKNLAAPAPGVLCPHGHWQDGRFLWASDQTIQQEMASGAESIESCARSVLQARCVHLARMGCVVFHYDMLGYADSQQISYAVAHGFSQRRPQMETPERWGLFSPRAEMELQSVMGLQTWNSMRALDFLESLPDVDATRLAVTGASGGGTQTFMLAALDDRVQVAFPAVMVSTAMQGGCTCENCCNLRVDCGNVDFAALFAPKPLGLTAANDWTREMETKGFPELQKLFRALETPDNVSLTSRLEFGHNYNAVSRQAMYEWFHRHLNLPDEPIVESPFPVKRREELTVFGDGHPAPPGGDAFESVLLYQLAADSRRQLGLHLESTLEDFQQAIPQLNFAWQSIVRYPEGAIDFVKSEVLENINWTVEQGMIQNDANPIQTPAVRWARRNRAGDQPRQPIVALFVGRHGTGFNPDVEPDWWRWLQQNQSCVNVWAVDMVYQGALSETNNPQGENRLVDNGRHAAGYTFGYNRTVAAWRIAQLTDAIRVARKWSQEPSVGILLVATDEYGLEAVAAAVSMGLARRDTLAVYLDGQRWSSITELTSASFLPGAQRYGDVAGCLGILAERGASVVVADGIGDIQSDLLRFVDAPDRVRVRVLDRPEYNAQSEQLIMGLQQLEFEPPSKRPE